jgi:pilus assembly protein Flp/PilA
MVRSLKNFFFDESGATMVEYAILVALISVAAIAIIFLVGQEINTAFTRVLNCIKSPSSCS